MAFDEGDLTVGGVLLFLSIGFSNRDKRACAAVDGLVESAKGLRDAPHIVSCLRHGIYMWYAEVKSQTVYGCIMVLGLIP
jgi:hypothetical protein